MRQRRTLNFEESASLRLTRVAETLKQQGKKIYGFGIGEPDFTTPERIIKAAFRKAEEGGTHYTPAGGIMELRKAVSEKLRTKNGIDSTPDSVLITPSKYAIYMGIFTTCLPGDEVLVPDPYYLSYPDITKLAGALPVFVPTDKDYEFDLDEASKLVTPKTKLFLLNSPSNPTGKVYSERSIRKLADFILENDLMLLSDEIYEDLIFEGTHFSPASIPEMRDHTLTVSGFSKSYAMTGWRIGYLQGPKEIINSSIKIQGQSITCAPSVSQYAALEALRSDAEVVQFREAFRRRRELVMRMLSEIESITVKKPEGTFYAFPEFNADMGTEEFCTDLLNQKQVIVTPGTAFGESGNKHFRLSFATSDEVIEQGISRIGEFVNELNQK